MSSLIRCLGVGKVFHSKGAIELWKEKMDCFTTTTPYHELDRIHGDPMVFECENVPGHRTLQLLHEVQTMMKEMKCGPELFKDRIIFMTMYNDIDWDKKDNGTVCVCVLQILKRCPIMKKNF